MNIGEWNRSPRVTETAATNMNTMLTGVGARRLTSLLTASRRGTEEAAASATMTGVCLDTAR
jgi:hypothetical protein